MGPGQATDFEREVIARRGIQAFPVDEVAADPEGAAARAVVSLEDRYDRLLVHFDVDVIDFTDVPLSENTGRNEGLAYDVALRALAVLLASPRLGGLTITELNPAHTESGGGQPRASCRRRRPRARIERLMSDVRGRAEQLVRSPVQLGDLALAFDETTAATVAVHVTGREFFPRILEDIASATSSIHIIQYGFRPGAIGEQFASALLAKAAEGVAVRLVVDQAGSRPGRSGGFYERLRAGGIDVRVDQKPWRIDHRKQYVVDGRVGWVGGAGIEDHFEDGRFHDLFLRLTGPVVAQLQLVFLASFRWLDGAVAPEQLDALFPALEPGAIPAAVLHNAPGPVPADHDRHRGAARRRARDARRGQPVRRRQGDDRGGSSAPPAGACASACSCRPSPTTARAPPRSSSTTASCSTRACASSATRRCCTRRRSSAMARRSSPAPATSRRGASSASSRSTCACARPTFAAQFDERFSAPAEAVVDAGEAPAGIGQRLEAAACAAISPLL